MNKGLSRNVHRRRKTRKQFPVTILSVTKRSIERWLAGSDKDTARAPVRTLLARFTCFHISCESELRYTKQQFEAREVTALFTRHASLLTVNHSL